MAKMKLAVLRHSGAGFVATVNTTPLNDINANKMVHPSMFTFLWGVALLFTSSGGFCATTGPL